MTKVQSLPSPGAIARVRQRTYLVEQVIEGNSASDSTLVRLSCVDDDNQGVPLEVLWENEIEREVLTGEAWESVAKKGFDNPKVFGAYLNTLRWNCVTSTDPKLFQSPFRAGIKLEAYQLEPLRKALLLPRVNLFIADDVGLGKTIEASRVRQGGHSIPENVIRRRFKRGLVNLFQVYLPCVDEAKVFDGSQLTPRKFWERTEQFDCIVDASMWEQIVHMQKEMA